MTPQTVKTAYTIVQAAFVGIAFIVGVGAFMAKLDSETARHERECQEACVKW